MELHVIENQGEIRYPVGSHIMSAISFVDKALLIIEEKITFKNANILIWCRGSSGAILAGLLASKLIGLYPTICTKVVHVKKKGEQAHDTDIEHIRPTKTYTTNIIIDDFSYTGETIMSIAREMATKEVQYIDLLILSNIQTIWNSETRERALPFPVPTTLIVGDYNSSYYSGLPGLKPTLLKEIL